MADANVIVRLSVVRPDAEYMVERLKRLLSVHDPYMGWTHVLRVDILSGEVPIPPEYLSEALATLPEKQQT